MAGDEAGAIDGIVGKVIGIAVAEASRRSPADAVTLAILSALGEVHGLFVHGAGLGAARNLEDALRGRLLTLALERRRSSESDAGPSPANPPLPSRRAHDTRADLLLADAVQSCLSINMVGPGNVALERAAHILLEHLIRRLDGPPAWEDLISVFAREDEPGGRAEQTLQAPRPLLQ